MKNYILHIVILLLISNTGLISQDLIIYIDGDELETKVLKIGKDEVVYKKYNNLKGPEYTEDISNIFMIKYEGGSKDIFNQNSRRNKKELEDNDDIILRAGTNIQIYLANKISSKNLRNGDIIPFYVKQNITSYEGHVIIAANTYVEGRVTNAEKAEAGGVQGELDLMVNSITAVNGSSIPVFLNLNNEGEDKGDEAIGVGLFLFWPALFMKGGEAEMDAGSIVIVQTTQDTKFNLSELKKMNEKVIINTPSNIDKNNVIIKNNKQEKSNQENPCGKKPEEPFNRFNKYQFELTKEYKTYKRKLFEWEQCMGK